MFTADRGEGRAQQYLQSRLYATHFDGHGRLKNHLDLGSGNVQENFVMGLALDQLGAATNLAAPLISKIGKYMYSGTGTTANTYDYELATTAGPASGAVTPTLGVSADNSTLQFVGTVNYTSTLAITEWGLFSTNSQGAAYSTTSSTVTANTVTPTTGPGWTANEWAGYVVVDTSAATTVAGFIISNTTTALTIGEFGSTGWYDLTAGGGAGTTPAGTDTLGIYPLMADHKTFAAINVASGDSIQFTYTLTFQSGG